VNAPQKSEDRALRRCAENQNSKFLPSNTIILLHQHSRFIFATTIKITMSGMINGGGSPYKKRKLLDAEANESSESVRLEEEEEETKLPENSAALSVTKTVAAALPNTGVMMLGGMSLPAPEMKVTAATTSDHNMSEDDSDTNATVYVGNLHPVIQQAHVEKLLGKYGTIQRLDMLPNKHCCFCHYETRNQAHGNCKSTWKELIETDTQGAVGKFEIITTTHRRDVHKRT
jgi:hypothetical protein